MSALPLSLRQRWRQFRDSSNNAGRLVVYIQLITIIIIFSSLVSIEAIAWFSTQGLRRQLGSILEQEDHIAHLTTKLAEVSRVKEEFLLDSGDVKIPAREMIADLNEQLRLLSSEFHFSASKRLDDRLPLPVTKEFDSAHLRIMRAERAVSASLRTNRELTRADGLALLQQYPLADLRRVEQNLLGSHLNLNLLAIDLEKELDEAERFYEWILIMALIFASLVAMVSSSLVYRRTIVRPLESISIIASSVPSFDVESDATEGVSALHKAVNKLDQSTLGSTEIQSLSKAMVSLLSRLITVCEMLNDLSMTDPLCQIGNRRALKLYGSKIWQQAARAECPVGVLMIDVDHFKQYNDGYGHAKGDNVLRDLAQAFSRQLRRPLDDVYRYGGEEFVLVMYDLSAEKFADLCEQIRVSVESLSIDHRYVASGLITISGGGYYAPNTRSMSMDAAIQAADHELYRSKKLGRNRISIDDSGIQQVQCSI